MFRFIELPYKKLLHCITYEDNYIPKWLLIFFYQGVAFWLVYRSIKTDRIWKCLKKYMLNNSVWTLVLKKKITSKPWVLLYHYSLTTK